MKGKLILENGLTLEGEIFGHLQETIGEVVFNTGMTGYQEILTDPSYFGQIVVMTYPLIGNYGVNYEDLQSSSVKVKGLIVRETCQGPSNWRNEMDLESYMKEEKIMGIKGMDTRYLTKLIRQNGTLKGMITGQDIQYEQVKKLFTHNPTKDAVKQVSTKEIYKIPGQNLQIAVLDLGIKKNILQSFTKRDCQLTVFPAHTSASEILSSNPDGVFLSNGPGDPKELDDVIKTVKSLIGSIPIIGICLGHQVIALSCGGDTEKMVYGHRGSNHPVKNVMTDRVTITSQNHGYVVKKETIPDDFQITHINMNDQSIEGFKSLDRKVMSVQFHPEASPGPEESSYIFDDFITMIQEDKYAAQ